jgi:hypothetical protein
MLMILLDRHIPINGISCREKGDAVKIDRIVVGTKTGNVLHSGNTGVLKTEGFE